MTLMYIPKDRANIRNIYLTHLPLDKMATNLAGDIFKFIFLNGNYRISIQISLKFVPRSRKGDKPLTEPMMTLFNEA